MKRIFVLMSNNDIDASRTRSVALRRVAASCIDCERNLAELDSEINAFNDLLATKCGVEADWPPTHGSP